MENSWVDCKTVEKTVINVLSWDHSSLHYPNFTGAMQWLCACSKIRSCQNSIWLHWCIKIKTRFICGAYWKFCRLCFISFAFASIIVSYSLFRFIKICEGLIKNRDIFEKYFKDTLFTLRKDKVINIRIALA